ncbi:MAG: MBL fold metallo-hydrolase [Pelolinea sp.]|jgi:glyoxylase-like metal-dependent hydrolase (beta-lactamase superfamily II)|nr:MBL fold metallo-hydrolase [Pelolinea sp.]
MIRERISENVYWFQSDVYAQVAAGAVIGTDWAVVIDTLPVQEETLEIREFIEDHLKVPVRFVINTIYHADHTWGNCFFPGAGVIAHTLGRKLVKERNVPALENAQRVGEDYLKTKIILPQITLDAGAINLKVGKKSLKIFTTPGNSPDGISVFVREDRILFTGDSFLPLPVIVEGDVDQLVQTIESFKDLGLENIVQGHGDVILRGEIEGAIDSNLRYLNEIKKVVATALKRKDPQKVLEEASVESCGKSRVLLSGLVEELHRRNLLHLYQQELAKLTPGS